MTETMGTDGNRYLIAANFYENKTNEPALYGQALTAIALSLYEMASD